MKLRQALPGAVEGCLTRLGVDSTKLVLQVQTDINARGQYAAQWLLADAGRMLVLDEADPKPILLDLPMSEAEDFRTITAVGSGILQIKTQGIWLDAIRFSNSLKYTFDRTGKRLKQLKDGQTIEFEADDEHDPRRCQQCGLLLEFTGETCPRCIDRSRAMARVLQLMRPYWRQAALMMVLLLLGIGLNLIEPLLTRYMVDNVLALPSPDAEGPVPLTSKIVHASMLLLFLVGTVAFFQLLRVGIGVLNGRLGSKVATAITYDMRGRLVEHLSRLSLAYYDKQQSGSLVGRVAYDTEAVQGFVGQLTGGFLMQIIMVVCSACMMFSLAPKLAIWTLLPAPFVFAGTYAFYRLVLPKYRRFWELSSRQAGMLNGLLSGIRVVKAFAQEARELNRFDTSSAALRDARRKVDISSATFYPAMFLIFQVGGWIVWYVGGSEVLQHNADPKQGISLGTLMAFFGLMWMFYNPLNALTNLTSWITQFSTQMHRIFEVLDTAISIPEAATPKRLPEIRGEIEFQNVVFGYSRQNPVIKGVTFSIKPGEMIGVVGRSGSGKTTIINLISRFYDVDEGRVLIDGIDLRQLAMQDVRRHIGVVLQEPFLFRGTIWDNLTYGRTQSTIEEGMAAARAGNAHDFILRQPHGYDTRVGERGAGLSGGERQRLSIARALLCEPRVLILDEATSSVDSESELQIQQALAQLVKGRTSIIIAHRLSTLRNCDRIYVVDEGRIVESGPHNELMKLNGKYARMVRIQTSVSKDATVDHVIQREIENKEDEGPQRTEVTTDPDTGLTPITGHHPRWLKPEIASVHLGDRNVLDLTIRNERVYKGVYALYCLPVSYPDRYISLRWLDEENREQEVGLICNLADWPPEAREVIQASLTRRYLLHQVSGILDIEPFHNYLQFTVRTDRGEMKFILRQTSASAIDYGPTGKLLTDVEENRFVIPDVTALSPGERLLFERYIFW